jgi:hypothetical protein
MPAIVAAKEYNCCLSVSGWLLFLGNRSVAGIGCPPEIASALLWSAEILRHSCSAGQESVFVVKAIQDGVSHNSA